MFNFGQELSTLEKDLSAEEKKKFKACRLVKNDSVNTIIDKIEKLAKSDRSCIIEGFPKNLSQALILQQKGIYAKNLLVVNVHE